MGRDSHNIDLLRPEKHPSDDPVLVTSDVEYNAGAAKSACGYISWKVAGSNPALATTYKTLRRKLGRKTVFDPFFFAEPSQKQVLAPLQLAPLNTRTNWLAGSSVAFPAFASRHP